MGPEELARRLSIILPVSSPMTPTPCPVPGDELATARAHPPTVVLEVSQELPTPSGARLPPASLRLALRF